MSQFKVLNLCNITKFDGTYLHVWKYNIKLVLISENLLKLMKDWKLNMSLLLPLLVTLFIIYLPLDQGVKKSFKKMIHMY